MAGQPQTRERKRKEALAELQRLREEEYMQGRAFTGHAPPSVEVEPLPEPEPEQADLDIATIGQLVTDDIEVARHLGELWPKVYDALEQVLDSADATAASKVAAGRVVQQAMQAERDARKAAMPQRIEFITAAYVP